MDEIKGRLRQLVRHQIEAAHLDPIARNAVEQAGVEIHRKHRAGTSDPVCKHPRDRASAGADIQTSPALPYTDRVQLYRH